MYSTGNDAVTGWRSQSGVTALGDAKDLAEHLPGNLATRRSVSPRLVAHYAADAEHGSVQGPRLGEVDTRYAEDLWSRVRELGHPIRPGSSGWWSAAETLRCGMSTKRGADVATLGPISVNTNLSSGVCSTAPDQRRAIGCGGRFYTEQMETGALVSLQTVCHGTDASEPRLRDGVGGTGLLKAQGLAAKQRWMRRSAVSSGWKLEAKIGPYSTKTGSSSSCPRMCTAEPAIHVQGGRVRRGCVLQFIQASARPGPPKRSRFRAVSTNNSGRSTSNRPVSAMPLGGVRSTPTLHSDVR